MKKKKINFNYNKKNFSINLFVCNSFEKIFGLMFRRKEKAKALLFEFKKPTKLSIHSFFVFFPFLGIWLDDKNKVIKKKVVKQFRWGIAPKKEFFKLIEVPLSKKYSWFLKTFLPDDKIRKI